MQIIDSLSPGGSEQMAVNLANGLAAKGVATFLLVTHDTGLLAEKIDKNVEVTILNKKNGFDIGAFLRLLKTVKTRKITVLHAHSSSVFWATAIKLFNPGLKLIWHDHYGNSEMLDSRPYRALKICSPFWHHVISVNRKLSQWAENRLGVPKSKVTFLNNFAVLQSQDIDVTEFPETLKNAVNIVNVANLRPQKDHGNLLTAFEMVASTQKDAILHLIGVNPGNEYSATILEKIKEHPYSDRIYYWGARKNVAAWLKYMQIGVLASLSEGLPVSLLEYGIAGLQIVSTNVGQVADVLDKGKLGHLVDPASPTQLAQAILKTIADKTNWMEASANLKQYIEQNFSEDASIKKLIEIYS